jgi:D-galactonate transporter
MTLLQWSAGLLSPGVTALAVLVGLRFLLGVAEAPSFPANGRIVTTWFPTGERGFASAAFNAAQYAATIAFSPIMGTIADRMGWPSVFAFMGLLGVALAVVWPYLIRSPREHPWANAAEVAYIHDGGGLVDMDEVKSPPFSVRVLRQLIQNRMFLGICLGQYCINVLTWFFLTWFPIYLVTSRGMTILQAGMVAALPAIFGLVGGILGGLYSDWLLRRGWSLTAARKIPIVAGLLLSVFVIGCNYVRAPWEVVLMMSIAYFGKGVGSLGWAVIADVSPKEAIGLSGSVFNTFGNVAGIVTPIVIGYLVDRSGSFNGALVFVGAHAVVGVLSFLIVVGKIRRITLSNA